MTGKEILDTAWQIRKHDVFHYNEWLSALPHDAERLVMEYVKNRLPPVSHYVDIPKEQT